VSNFFQGVITCSARILRIFLRHAILFLGDFRQPLDVIQENIDGFEALAVSALVSQLFETKMDLELLSSIFGADPAIT
jgi:hypothetical protein